MRLRDRILVSYILISLVPLLAVTVMNWLQISRFVTAQLELSAADSTRRVAGSLAAELRIIDNVTITVFADARTRQILARQPGNYSIRDQLSDMAYLQGFLRSIQDSQSLILRLRLLVPTGRVYSNQKVNLVSAESAPELARFLAANAEQRTLLAFRTPDLRYFALPDTEPIDVISFVRPISVGGTSGQFLAGVVVDVRTAAIVSLVERASVLDRAVFSLRLGEEPLLTTVLGSAGPAPADSEAVHDGMLALEEAPVYHDFHLRGWVPFNEIFEQNVAWRNDMIVLIAVVAAAAWLLSVVVANTSTRRVRDLSVTMRDLDYANPARITVSGRDEVSELQHGFNELVGRLGAALAENYEAGLRARQAEMNLLQAQVNPHFLYNTLELLSGIARDAGSARMERIVQTLADYYKFSLRKGRNTVSLGEELQHVQRYVEIENERHGNAVTLLTSMPEEYLPLQLPKITLQPLVENGILHGIAKKPDPTGTVFIAAHRRDDLVIVTIRDDGIGMTAERLAQVRAAAPAGAEVGFGIYSVRVRLGMLYGSAASLEVESEPGAGTKVSIVFPGPDTAS